MVENASAFLVCIQALVAIAEAEKEEASIENPVQNLKQLEILLPFVHPVVEPPSLVFACPKVVQTP
jgi:hypothetical protein